MNKEFYTFDVMHEAAATEDGFPDQTHDKTAATLQRLMRFTEQGLTIGLEGGWGSGKSTVVNLLKQRLKDEGDDTLFFLYDAWAHEGDPLRRIFLESLIDDIELAGGDEILATLKGKISGRKKTVKVSTKRSASRLGGFISLAAIFVPVGVAILSAIDYVYVSMPWSSTSGDPHFLFLTGLFLALMPLWVLVLWLFLGEKDSESSSQGLIAGKKWDLFAAESTENYTQDITEDGERTSIEFEEFFQKIMENSIGEGKKFNRALIVIDNLDRIDPDQTLAIWSILQTFFQYRSGKPTAIWRDRLWILIPYDRTALSRVWSQERSKPSEEGKLIDDYFPGKAENNSNGYNAAPSFFEKCFQIVAEVPEPVMSAWVAYSEKNIRHCLSGWPADEVQVVIDVFKQYESRLESSPTPRQIRSFVNRVGMLGIRYGGEASAEAIALYALSRRHRSDREMRTVLLGYGMPDGYEPIGNSDYLKGELAGILFGVDREKGMQLLLQSEIANALRSGDGDKLKAIIKAHGEAFWIVWDAIKASCLPGSGHGEEYRLPVTTAFCQSVSGYEERASRSVDHLIAEWKNSVHKWDLSKHDYAEPLDALLNVLPSHSDFVSWVDETVKSMLSETVTAVGGTEFDSKILPHLANLISMLEKHGKVRPKMRCEGLNQNQWKAWRTALSQTDVDIPSLLPAKGVVEAIANSLNVNNPNADELALLAETLSCDSSNQEWKAVIDKMVQWAGNPNPAGSNLPYTLMMELYLQSEGDRQTIDAVIVSNAFVQKSSQENLTVVYDLLCLTAIVLEEKLLSSVIAAPIKKFWASVYNKASCEKAISSLISRRQLKVVWLLARDASNSVASGVILDGSYDKYLFASELGPISLDKLVWLPDDQVEGFVNKFVDNGGLKAAKTELVGSPVVYEKCLKMFFDHGGEYARQVVRSAIDNAKADDWMKSLKDDGALFHCLEEKGNHEYKHGFIGFIEEELKDGKLSAHVWNDLERFLSKAMDREEVEKRLAVHYFDLDNDPLDNDKFGNVSRIIEGCVPELTHDHVMARTELWISKAQWDRIEWLLSVGFYAGVTPTESLVSRARGALGADENSGNETLLSLADALGIDIATAAGINRESIGSESNGTSLSLNC